MKKILAVDVDLTVIASDRAHWEALAAMVSWFPSADTYRRLGFDPEAPMQVLTEVKALLFKGAPMKEHYSVAMLQSCS